jgi:F-type H+-transporting ATPase subunit delta
MSVEVIARRYAGALADSVGKDASIVQDELKMFEKMMSESSDLSTMFANPAINHATKVNVLEAIISKSKPSKTSANFLRVLLENGRIVNIADINKTFVQVLSERSGEVSANVTSARELTAKEQKDLQANIEKLTGKKVNLSYEINTEIIGGIVTRIGSTVYDSSVKTQLQNLKQQLVNG